MAAAAAGPLGFDALALGAAGGAPPPQNSLTNFALETMLRFTESSGLPADLLLAHGLIERDDIANFLLIHLAPDEVTKALAGLLLVQVRVCPSLCC